MARGYEETYATNLAKAIMQNDNMSLHFFTQTKNNRIEVYVPMYVPTTLQQQYRENKNDHLQP